MKNFIKKYRWPILGILGAGLFVVSGLWLAFAVETQKKTGVPMSPIIVLIIIMIILASVAMVIKAFVETTKIEPRRTR